MPTLSNIIIGQNLSKKHLVGKLMENTGVVERLWYGRRGSLSFIDLGCMASDEGESCGSASHMSVRKKVTAALKTPIAE